MVRVAHPADAKAGGLFELIADSRLGELAEALFRLPS